MRVSRGARDLTLALANAATQLDENESQKRSLLRHISKLHTLSVEGAPKEKLDDNFIELKKKIGEVVEGERLLFRRSIESDLAGTKLIKRLEQLEERINNVQPPTLAERIATVERKHRDLQKKGASKEHLDGLQKQIHQLKSKVASMPENRSVGQITPTYPSGSKMPFQPDQFAVAPRQRHILTPEEITGPPEELPPSFIVKAPDDHPFLKLPDHPVQKISFPSHEEILPDEETVPFDYSEEVSLVPRLRPPGPMPHLEETIEKNKPILTMKGIHESVTNPPKPRGILSRIKKS